MHYFDQKWWQIIIIIKICILNLIHKKYPRKKVSVHTQILRIKGHVTLKTGVMGPKNVIVPSQE